MISIITPTHNTKYLSKAYESLLKQTHKDWEWVIVPNNGASHSLSFKDARVRVVPYTGKTTTNIGSIKKWAFLKGKGNILVELDHDDTLLPTALEKLYKVFKETDADFVYSNSAEYYEGTNKPREYFGEGWDDRKRYHTIDGVDYLEVIQPDPSALTVSWIYYAPNHVRAWKREFYEAIGGHSDLAMCDDQELLIRTYLKGKMVHLDELLYLQRHHADNEQNNRFGDIQEKTQELHRTHIFTLVSRECDLRELPKIDLGAGHRKPKGWIGIDIEKGEGVDIVCDVTKGLPYADNSVGAVRAIDFMEHIPDKLELIKEIYRVLVPGGWVLSMTPSTDGRGAFQDPTHVAYYNLNSFFYYSNSQWADYIGTPVRFQAQDLYDVVTNEELNIIHTVFNGVALKEGYSGMGKINI